MPITRIRILENDNTPFPNLAPFFQPRAGVADRRRESSEREKMADASVITVYIRVLWARAHTHTQKPTRTVTCTMHAAHARATRTATKVQGPTSIVVSRRRTPQAHLRPLARAIRVDPQAAALQGVQGPLSIPPRALPAIPPTSPPRPPHPTQPCSAVKERRPERRHSACRSRPPRSRRGSCPPASRRTPSRR